MTTFPTLQNQSFAQKEHEILALWEKLNAFNRSVSRREKNSKNKYVFYDGPPFATGLPHYGHFVASTIKDTVARYWTMRGMHVERTFGWDTHGLPIEMELEKSLNVKGPQEIRNFGIANFNEACRSVVLRYTKEWQTIISRLGRWVDFENGFKTMDKPFMESVWWAFSQLWQKGLVYNSFRVMPYSWRLATPLSNFEANSDYRDVQDPSITIKFILKNDVDNAKLLVWTTTPWTLPSNLAIAVNPELTYVKAKKSGLDEVYVLAESRVASTLGEDAQILASFSGKELVEKKYEPLFAYFSTHANAFRIVSSSHVTDSDGTGLVHLAPAYGEDDYKVCLESSIALVDPIDEEGKFLEPVHDFVGMNFKDADSKIIKALKEKGLIFKHDTLQHSYPYCWRSGTPLMYKAVPVWCVRVTDFKDRMVAHNENIHWVPEAVGSKRFGNWLKDAADWTISRNRFWGTPIPIWICDACSERKCISSVAELEKKTGAHITDLHSHHIDALTFACETCSRGTMKRISEVFDCWFESGSMPYAQQHYPFENVKEFEENFPANFIAEGLDQTRAWFYTLLVLSTALFDSHPFKNVIVNGLVLAEDGSKMSKSKRNYPDPLKVLEEHGADALRAYLINSPVVRAEPLQFSESGVKEVVRAVILPLFHAWSFFVQYANIDKVDVSKVQQISRGLTAGSIHHTDNVMDAWILSKLQSLVKDSNEHMEGYYLYKVVPPMVSFIDDLTNWYIRLNRRRFWRNASDEQGQRDKDAAYATLYQVLVTLSKVLAPVLPFISEEIYQNLVVAPKMHKGDEDSVHLCDYPQAIMEMIDTKLEREIELARSVVHLGRALREKHRIRTKQPLRAVTVVSHVDAEREALVRYTELIASELNVKEVRVLERDDGICELEIRPDFKSLGARFGARMKDATKLLSAITLDDFHRLQQGEYINILDEKIGIADLKITRKSKGEVILETEGHLTVALDTHVDDVLKAEGLMRELVSHLQRLRKESNFEVTERIKLTIETESTLLLNVVELYKSHIMEEVLAVELHAETVGDAAYKLEIGDVSASVELKKI